jgi:hypothetical protein
MKVELESVLRELAMAYFNVPSKDILEGSLDERESATYNGAYQTHTITALCEMFLTVYNGI